MNLHHCGALRRENAAAKGERIIEEALQRLGWKESDSAGHPKSDPDKLAMAPRLRRETTMSIKGIAAQVNWAVRRV